MTRDEWWKQWDVEGTAAARAHLESASSSPESRDWTREWMYHKLETQQATRDDEQRALSYRSLAATEHSSEAARQSALASHSAAQASQQSADIARRAAFWTMIAALASLLGILVNAAINLGWLDWAKHVPH